LLSPRPISINCDLGESWEAYRDGGQADCLRLTDLANVCCGAHAGDAELTRLTMFQVAEGGVRAGAHPGYPDPKNFGRRPLFRTQLTATQVMESVAEQISLASTAARQAGLRLYHVKPHGALYNEACPSTEKAGELAEAIANGVIAAERNVILLGLSGSQMLRVFRRMGFSVLRESFADRAYGPDGFLRPRTEPGALLEDDDSIREQIDRLQPFTDTFCVHGDSADPARKLKLLRKALGR